MVEATGPNPVREELPPEAYRDMVRILRGGLLLSLALLSAGVIAFVAANPSLAFQTLIATNPILHFLGLSGLAHGLATGQPEAYLTLGVLVLVATPVARVLTGSYFFAKNGERTIAVIALLVAAMLVTSLLVIGPLIR